MLTHGGTAASGTQTLGRYQLRREIGRGAMGVVHEAYDEVLERTVAVKTVNAGIVDADEREATLERFAREAKTAARITHPNIVTIFDYGSAGDTAYIVMELVDAPSLKLKLKEAGQLGLAEAHRVITQLLDALAAAHRNGIVHRDVKPSNILVMPSGQIKVTDFGIARIDNSTLTQTGKTLGTPSYMAPEQLRGLPLDGRADLFSAGVVLYEMLAGQQAFAGNTTAVIYKVLNEIPEPASTLNSRISPHIDAVIAKALQKEPAARFDSAEMFLDAWRRAIAVTQAAAARATPAVVARDAPTERLNVASAAPPAATSMTRPKNSWIVVGIAIVGVVGGVGAYVTWQRSARTDAVVSAVSPAPATTASIATTKPVEQLPPAAMQEGATRPTPEESAAEKTLPAQIPPDSAQAKSPPAPSAGRVAPAPPAHAQNEPPEVGETIERVRPLEVAMLTTLAQHRRPAAMNKLGVAYREGIGVAVDYINAKRLFEEAAALGYPPAMHNLANLYRDGKGVERSDAKAFAWSANAAAKGNLPAMNALGFMYLKGRGVAQDESRAVEWFRRAALAGDKAAMFNLAFMYEHGRGVAKSPLNARQWYQRAAKQGEQRARERLVRGG